MISDATALAFKPDGQQVAVATMNGHITFFNPTTGQFKIKSRKFKIFREMQYLKWPCFTETDKVGIGKNPKSVSVKNNYLTTGLVAWILH